MSEVKLDFADMRDLDSWMKLVRNVRENFPGLETEELLKGYERTVEKNIKRKTALCAKDENEVVGVLLFSEKYNMLCFMAVDPRYRCMGIASQLIKMMFQYLDKEKDIVVTTFREDDEKGIAPRSLYRKFGFIEDELVEEFGYPNQKFILHP